MHSSGGSQVWVGNVPFDATEDELREVMNSAGPVLSIRIVHDKDTGLSRGFSFCEYRDIETCIMAIKSLNGYELRGRSIRVDWASQDMRSRYNHLVVNNSSGTAPVTATAQSGIGIGQQGTEALHHPISLTTSNHVQQIQEDGISIPSIPTNNANFDNISSEIIHLVQGMTISQLYYLIGHMQKLVVQNPETARSILLDNPQFCYALLHAQFILGMVNEPFVPLNQEQLNKANSIRTQVLNTRNDNTSINIKSLGGDISVLIEDIASNPNPALLQALASIQPNSVAQWTEEEKSKILAIQQVLKNRGLIN
ncbi:cleavage stimulation factor subunit 2 [Cryptosporidium ubiquitum]|uniref:Cleavage stimulation factor subunit 2 n=1 Tax=Cryptosporidium ubiquitum TaxID=857276 RepID=A0A1J4MK40_9CRYT|nr:cleavage stimulation factor subunit 2 [Cryptosporidium ubiquitum]OII74574.1 cleavage stimulation factor subunit 2 [Cryptosporidium ubiquitum]